eukprot:2009779-Pleurochrysis_carterae.AAC.1
MEAWPMRLFQQHGIHSATPACVQLHMPGVRPALSEHLATRRPSWSGRLLLPAVLLCSLGRRH